MNLQNYLPLSAKDWSKELSAVVSPSNNVVKFCSARRVVVTSAALISISEVNLGVGASLVKPPPAVTTVLCKGWFTFIDKVFEGLPPVSSRKPGRARALGISPNFRAVVSSSVSGSCLRCWSPDREVVV